MQKNLLLFSVLTAFSVSAQNLTEPTATWANLLIGKPGQDQATAIATDGNNQIYWMLTDGTTSDDRDVTYAGVELYQGASYEGTSSNKNLTLLKTDASGQKQWCVYSSMGDFSPSEGGIAVNSDGDIVFSTCVRHTEGYFSQPVTIVDAHGTATSLDWNIDDRRWDQLVVGTVSSDGTLKWIRTYSIDHGPVPEASASRADHTADAINNYGVAVDPDNNIYVCGNFRTALTLPTVSGDDVVLTPKNVTGWDGDSQKAVGSFYLVKLNQDGYYLDHVAEGGDEISTSYIQKIIWKNSLLYVYGYLKGDGNATVNIAGKDFTPNAWVCPLVGCFDSEFNARWLKCLPGGDVQGKNAVQNVGITVDDDSNIWLAGQYNGRISDPADAAKFVESTQGSLREGFIIRLNGENGDWISAANSRTDFDQNYLTGYFDVIVPASDKDNIYVYGYAMNASVGVFLRCYDKETLTGNPDKSWNIITKGGVPTCQCISYEPISGKAYVMVRGNQAFQPMGGELTENPGGYTNLLAGFNLPEYFTSGIDMISYETMDNVEFSSRKGLLEITNNSASAKFVKIYDIMGRQVKSVNLMPGHTDSINLPSGIYIAGNRKFVL